MSFKSLDSENAIGKTYFPRSWHGYFYQIKDNFLVVQWDSIEKQTSKAKFLMVSGLWIQNVGMQKMKLLMLNFS
jgi:hypothetical protein